MRDDTQNVTQEMIDTGRITLDYDEIKAAIPSLGFIDMVGFDGCNMASLKYINFGGDMPLAVAASTGIMSI